ncbi:MAG: isocitrate lyase/phosphoenolpyruvate mutase family protein, partial [Rhodospirillaceae bacterium]|nr:isocitrate lyase/phosphoenolpyruvate mutase family protein [Rhodospirillaceae bacterium]
RTDAVAVEGLDAALDRAAAYRDAGADILFVEALRSGNEIEAAMNRLGGTVPLLANMVEGGRTPIMSAANLQRLGYSVVIFPGGLVRALTKTMEEYFSSLYEHGTTKPFRDRMLDFEQLNDVVGTQNMLEFGRRYE